MSSFPPTKNISNKVFLIEEEIVLIKYFSYKTFHIAHFIRFSMGGYKKVVSKRRYSDKHYKIC